MRTALCSIPWACRCWLAAIATTIVLPVSVVAYPPESKGPELRVRRSSIHGRASFVTSGEGGAIALPASETESATMQFLCTHGSLFGITEPETQLRIRKSEVGLLHHKHTTFQQIHRGVPVFTGEINVHENAAGEIVCANGDFYEIPSTLKTIPTIDAAAAARIAKRNVLATSPNIETNELSIVDPGWYGDPPIGPHLAYHVVVTDASRGIADALFIDAHSGAVLDRWSLVHTLLDRQVFDGGGGPTLPGTLVRSEGQSAVGDVDTDATYDYLGDVYDYFFRAFGRDSLDGVGGPMKAIVHTTALGCPNAFWSISQGASAYCTDIIGDDVVAHESGHGLVVFTANLVYQNQGGQLHEHFADTFGELIDLFNGNVAFAGPPDNSVPWPTHSTGPGLDTPNSPRTGACSFGPSYPNGVRWLIGEDAPALGSAIRDMYNPTCHGHPNFANSTLQSCNLQDAGGGHSGNGIPNHAFAMLTDGKSFNGFTVTGIGPIKSGAVWYRGLTTYLTSGADFEDAYWAFNQAAADLVGTFPNDPRTGLPSASMFTAADAIEVDEALRAVEMDTPGRCGAVGNLLDDTPPLECASQSLIFAEDFENGLIGWTLSDTGPPTPYDWIATEPNGVLPFDRAGRAAVCVDLNSSCIAADESALHRLDSPIINLPVSLNFPTLSLTHFVDTQFGADGGNIKIRVDGGPWQLIPAGAFYHNSYNQAFASAATGSTNPIAGEPAFTGSGGAWGTSLIALGSFVQGGESIQLRFEFAKDECFGTGGWYVDDVRVYDCTTSNDCNNNAIPDDVETTGGGQTDMFVQHLPFHSNGAFSDVDAGPVSLAQRFALLLPKTIHTVRLWGGYFPTDTPSGDNFTVVVHESNAGTGLPGAVIASESAVPASNATTGFTIAGVNERLFTLNLTNPVSVGPGEYWIEIFSDTTADANDDFFWMLSEYSSGIVNTATSNQTPGTIWSAMGTYHFAIEIDGDFIGEDGNSNGIPDSCEALGDFDGDGDVDLADFGIFTQCFGGAFNPPAPGCPAGVDADLDGDGDVDLGDFAIFTQNFTGAH